MAYKVNRFTQISVGNFRDSFAKAVKKFEEETGCRINLGNITFTDKQFTGKITVTVVEEGENGQEAEDKATLKSYGFRYGLTVNDYRNRKVRLDDGRIATVVSVKPRSSKYPIVVETSRGERFVVTRNTLTFNEVK